MRRSRILWQRLTASMEIERGVEGVYRDLEALYTGVGRRYHGLGHVVECLDHLSRYRTAEKRKNPEMRTVDLALWFHDAIYDPTRRDNESRSADFACDCCRRMGLDGEIAEEVARLVLITRHFEPTEIRRIDEEVVHDVDLVILGASPAEFRYYEGGVRYEYSHLTDEEFAAGRSRVCLDFLSRPTIYVTPFFHTAFEEAARANLRDSLFHHL